MNLFGISFILSAIVAFFIGTFVLYKDSKSAIHWIFFFFMLFIVEDSLIEFHMLISHSYEQASLWIKIVNMWPIILGLLMHFTFTFLKKNKEKTPIWLLGICYLPAIAFVILELLPGYIVLIPKETKFGWTYQIENRQNILSILMNVWASIVSLTLVIASTIFYLKENDFLRKRQALMLLFGNLVITIGAIISNVILVRVGERVPNTTMFGFLIGSAFLGFGVWRYKIFNISISSAAETIVDAMPEALFVLGRNDKILEFNPAAVRLTGLNNINLRNKNFKDLFEKNCSEIVSAHLVTLKEMYRKNHLTDIDLITKNGELIPVTITFSSIFDNSNIFQGLICIIRDVKEIKQSETENKILQSQLYQSQKMESIGRLAGGIAHDFNNMLAAISGYAEMIHRKFAADNPKLTKYIGIIESAAERSAELTSKLLTFARKGNVELTVLNVHEAITEAISILEHTIEKNIKLDIFLDADNPIVYADLAQLQNMFLNFCVNARDAMPVGGTLTIKTENVKLNNYLDKISHQRILDGDYISVSIEDNGIGMSEDVLNKIFEPFYTTKEQGKGTGLGLASAYGTVSSLNGFIDVESKENEGTTFIIYLPSSNDEISKTLHDDMIEEFYGEGRILIVDDEDVVRSVSIDMCRGLGYVPISASNTKDALSYYKKHFKDIQIVILDVIMPEMDGPVCYDEMLKINPDLKVIFASGYTKDENIDALLKNKNVKFLQKPFRSKTLSRVIKELI